VPAKRVKIPTAKAAAASTQKRGRSPSAEDTKGKKAKTVAVPSLGGSGSFEPESLNFEEL
jgi:hypothetical protein